ncbi:MAG: hypothetical protein ACK5PQ_05700 [Alphaproteobacteria bacterium]
MMHKPSILKTVKHSLGFTFKHIVPFLKFWTLPFLGSTLFYILSSYYIPADHWVIATFMSLISILINLIAASFWVPKWINFYNTPKKGIKVFAFEQNNKNYLKKSSYFFGILAIISSLDLVLSFTISVYSPLLALILFILCSLFMAYIAYRTSFALPAAALGDPMSFRESWERSKGYALSFFGTLIVILLITNLPSIILSFITLALDHLYIEVSYPLTLHMGGTILFLFTSMIFFGTFTLAWVDFYKAVRN